ncbi:MAG: hypothetical protein ACOC1K_01275 [Nanoarchaeota archaeon]
MEDFYGMRLVVVRHSRDCDGTPLYELSFDKSLINYEPLDLDDLSYFERESYIIKRSKMEGGFSEEDLTIIK